MNPIPTQDVEMEGGLERDPSIDNVCNSHLCKFSVELSAHTTTCSSTPPQDIRGTKTALVEMQPHGIHPPQNIKEFEALALIETQNKTIERCMAQVSHQGDVALKMT